MARNKYPEKTVEKILEVSYRLFVTKGYENVVILDIVNELGGLTKGALYHHFKSKEEILKALFEKMCNEHNIVERAAKYQELNVAEKIKAVYMDSCYDEKIREIDIDTLPLVLNPHFFANFYEFSMKMCAKQFMILIEEGIKDGSLSVDPLYIKESAELFTLLTKIWLLPNLLDESLEEQQKKIDVVKMVLDAIGLPLFDEKTMYMVRHYMELFYKADEKRGNTV